MVLDVLVDIRELACWQPLPLWSMGVGGVELPEPVSADKFYLLEAIYLIKARVNKQSGYVGECDITHHCDISKNAC